MSTPTDQIEAMLQEIEERNSYHDADCDPSPFRWCTCMRAARIRAKVARTIERMLWVAVQFSQSKEYGAEGVAAALEVMQDELRAGASPEQEHAP